MLTLGVKLGGDLKRDLAHCVCLTAVGRY